MSRASIRRSVCANTIGRHRSLTTLPARRQIARRMPRPESKCRTTCQAGAFGNAVHATYPLNGRFAGCRCSGLATVLGRDRQVAASKSGRSTRAGSNGCCREGPRPVSTGLPLAKRGFGTPQLAAHCSPVAASRLVLARLPFGSEACRSGAGDWAAVQYRVIAVRLTTIPMTSSGHAFRRLLAAVERAPSGEQRRHAGIPARDRCRH